MAPPARVPLPETPRLVGSVVVKVTLLPEVPGVMSVTVMVAPDELAVTPMFAALMAVTRVASLLNSVAVVGLELYVNEVEPIVTELADVGVPYVMVPLALAASVTPFTFNVALLFVPALPMLTLVTPIGPVAGVADDPTVSAAVDTAAP